MQNFIAIGKNYVMTRKIMVATSTSVPKGEKKKVIWFFMLKKCFG